MSFLLSESGNDGPYGHSDNHYQPALYKPAKERRSLSRSLCYLSTSETRASCGINLNVLATPQAGWIIGQNPRPFA
jgi:hypothetical protein